jgi:hypothetical protein
MVVVKTHAATVTANRTVTCCMTNCTKKCTRKKFFFGNCRFHSPNRPARFFERRGCSQKPRLKAFPKRFEPLKISAKTDRSWACIRMEAIQLNVKREIARAGSLPKNLTWSDWEFMQQQGIGKLDRTPKFEALCRQTHEFQDLAHILTRLRLLLATHNIA